MKKRIATIVSLLLAFALLAAGCGSSYGSANYSESKSASSEAAYAEAPEMAEEEALDEEWAEDYGTMASETADEAAPAAGASYAEGSAYSTEQSENGSAGSNAGGNGSGSAGSNGENQTVLSSDKLVYTCYMEIETTEYQKTVQAIREKISKYGAIVESESENDNDRNWYYDSHRKTSGTMFMSIRIRVPVKDYNAFVADAGDFGKVISKSQNVDNISRQYHSTEARIEALEKEEKRLNEMMDQADTIEEMIYIEQRLTDVEAELNAKKTNLAAMDVDVAYSTINIDVREVLVYTEEETPTITFGQRVVRAFKESWKGFTGFMEGLLIVLIHLLPFMVCLLLLALIIILLNRLADKRNPERKALRLQRKAEKKAAKERAKTMKMNRGFGPRPTPPAVNPPVPKEKCSETENKETEEQQSK